MSPGRDAATAPDLVLTAAGIKCVPSPYILRPPSSARSSRRAEPSVYSARTESTSAESNHVHAPLARGNLSLPDFRRLPRLHVDGEGRGPAGPAEAIVDLRTPHPFSGHRVDRAAEHRRDPNWLGERLTDPATRLVPVLELKSLVASGEVARALFLPPTILQPATEPIFLGELEGAAYFAVEVDEAAASALARDGDFVELRPLGSRLDPAEAAILAYARAMVYWHHRHRYCGVCGSPSRSEEAGHLRRCTDPICGAVHFPRTDPAIIVLVTHGDRCLLGRQASWAAGQYSTLAGFVEPGESLEEAVAREVREETGVALGEIDYHSSQPWPFPSSLMVGFTATAVSDQIRVDGVELEDARWFTRQELSEGIARGAFRLPSPASIAFALVDEWLRG